MKKGLLYHCLLVSLILHIFAVAVIKLEEPKKKEHEPIAIDLMGPLTKGPVTRLPEPDKKAEQNTLTPHPKSQARSYASRSLRPSFPSIPVPASPPPMQGRPQAPSPPPMNGGLSAPLPAPPMAGGSGRSGAAASSSAPRSAPAPERPSKLVMPTQADLERYARIDRDVEKSRDKDTITLDTDDLMYTSYMQGLKRRIEAIWKYPETARRDGLQGSLVMRFSIDKSGRVAGVDVLKSSGYPLLDEAAKQALFDASPFNSLPDNWHKDSFNITGTFIYRLYGGIDLR